MNQQMEPCPEWLSQVPAEVLDSLTPEQRAALWKAAHAPTWRRYPVNLRISVGVLGRRYFLTVVGGTDRRNPERRWRERRLHPLHSPGNILFAAAVASSLLLVAAVLLSLASALIEF